MGGELGRAAGADELRIVGAVDDASVVAVDVAGSTCAAAWTTVALTIRTRMSRYSWKYDGGTVIVRWGYGGSTKGYDGGTVGARRGYEGIEKYVGIEVIVVQAKGHTGRASGGCGNCNGARAREVFCLWPRQGVATCSVTHTASP